MGVTAAAALVLTALVTVGTAHAASTGYQITGLPTTLHIVTGSTWQITGTVVDPANANAPVANALVHVGIKEPSTGCGDLTTAACTDLANNGVFAFTDSAGHFTVASANIVGVATLDTLVVLYLDDDGSGPNGSQLDPSTGRSVVVHTHNTYAWAGPVHATMPQSELTSPTSMPAPWDQFSHPHSKVHIATVAGAANPHTEVKRGSGPWRTVATGVNGALPLLSPYGYSPLSLYG
ncbi:MAG: hypothetical protein JO222_02255, partial [Frankiales bacterium]|nr:hypothetical protein [Frankiales bacterium]